MLKNEKGVTLLELLIAVGILAIVIGPYLSQFVKATEIGERSERVVRAEYTAQEALEAVKRNPQPEKTGEDVTLNGFKVKVTYLDRTSTVSDSTGSLELYQDLTVADILIKPVFKNSKTEVDFTSVEGASLSKISSIKDDEILKLSLEKADGNNNYGLWYQIDEDTKRLVTSLIKEEGQEVVIRLMVPVSDVTGRALNIELDNQTENIDSKMYERPLLLFEYDDFNKNVEITRNIGSKGEVNLFLKLQSDMENVLDNDLYYYWIRIDVTDSNDEIMAQLYSSVRKQ